MKVDLMVIFFVVLTLVIKLCILDSMKEEVVEVPMTQLDVGNFLVTCHTFR